MIIYGTDQCPDCVACKADLDKAAISYEYRDITGQLKFMKEFLALRDHEEVFQDVRQEGYIGIPAIVLDSGEVMLSWENLI